jgi:hypothetical protein
MKNNKISKEELHKIFFSIKSINDMKLLWWLFSLSNKTTGRVEVTQGRREIICLHLKFQPSQFSRSLYNLINLNLLTGNKGNYRFTFVPKNNEWIIGKVSIPIGQQN